MVDILFEIHTLITTQMFAKVVFETIMYDTTSLNDVSSTTFFLQEPLQIGFVDTSLKDEFLKKPVKLVVLVKYSHPTNYF